MGYLRLSPFSPRARRAIREIFEDLARAAPFEGLLFHDDVTLSDFEDASPSGLAAYRSWGLPASIEEIRESDDLIGRWTILKINALDDFALELAGVVRDLQPALKVARNLYARVALNPKAEVWYSQALENSLARYDFTAIMAMPYMEKAADPAAFYRELVNVGERQPGGHEEGRLRAPVRGLAGGEPPDRQPASSPTPSAALYAMGVQHVGLLPGRAVQDDHPDAGVMRTVFDSKPNAPETR